MSLELGTSFMVDSGSFPSSLEHMINDFRCFHSYFVDGLLDAEDLFLVHENGGNDDTRQKNKHDRIRASVAEKRSLYR